MKINDDLISDTKTDPAHIVTITGITADNVHQV